MKNVLSVALLLMITLQSSFAHAFDVTRLTAVEQRNSLLRFDPKKHVLSPTSDDLPLLGFGPLTLTVMLANTFRYRTDVIPSHRKLIHPEGGLAAVRYVPKGNNGYTGIFSSPAIGIARFSLAGPIALLGYTPGLAIKFLVDYGRSQDLIVMNSVDGQGNDQNFFREAFASDLPPAQSLRGKFIESLFGMIRDKPGHLTVDHLAAVTPAGKAVPADLRRAPKIIVLIPDPLTTELYEYLNRITPKAEFRDQLQYVFNPFDKGERRLYGVFACERETIGECSNQSLIEMGSIYLQGPIRPSSFGDRHLVFKHM